MVAWVACPLGLAAAVGAAWGAPGLAVLGGQALVGSLLLEVINYVEVRPCGEWATSVVMLHDRRADRAIDKFDPGADHGYR